VYLWRSGTGPADQSCAARHAVARPGAPPMSDHVDATFRNATSIASQGAAARRLDASLAKLSAASAVKPAPAPAGPARPDKVDLSGSNMLRSFRDAAPFRDLGARLVDLRRLIASVGPTGPDSDAQGRIDASLASVRTAAASLRGASVDALASTTSIGPNTFNIRPGITDISVTAPSLGVGERLDINVIVVQSAQPGALRLSFGDSQLNLGGGAFAPSERFTVEIAGVNGSKELSFAS